MKRYTGQKALYEAINRSRGKVKRPNILERLRPASPEPEGPAREAPPAKTEPIVQAAPPPIEKPEVPTERPITPKPRPVEKMGRSTPGPAQTWLRPKPVQLNEGRLDVSVPYYVGIIAALAVVLALLVAFKLGQVRRDASYGVQEQPTELANVPTPTRSTPQNAATARMARPEPEVPAETPTETPAETPPVTPAAETPGDHWIVLAQYSKRADLDAVVDYFGDNGIELGVMPLTEESRRNFAEVGFDATKLPRGSGFLLVTTGKLYRNPENPDTDGYAMKQRIKALGAKYKAQAGMESFAPHYFSDAYGMKIK